MHKLKRIIAAPARFIYKVILFKVILPLTYLFSACGKVDEKKTVFIEVRLPKLSNNFTLLWERLSAVPDSRLSVCCLGLGSCGAAGYIRNCVKMAKSVARARYVFISEGSTAFSCLPVRRDTTVIQTWHGCGALKRVGMSALGNGGNVVGGRLERRLFPMCRHMDFITISSPGVAWAYEEAFDLHEGDGQRICPVGTSRTDIFFMPERISAARERICSLLPELDGRRILLYAPTFRGATTAAVMPDGMDLSLMCARLSEKYVLLIKHHPAVKQKQPIPEECRDFAFDMSEEPIDDLLMAADVCISDYSSAVFDYSLLRRPMVFFTYDADEYEEWRGLYYPLETFCPGKTASSTQELADILCGDGLYDKQKMEQFHELQMSSCDGHATDRIIALMNETPEKNKK